MATRTRKGPTPKAKKGLSPKTFRGLSKKKIQQGSSKNSGKRLILDKGKPAPVQFLEKPEDMTETERHIFQEDGRWEFVPCAGDACPLCEDDDEKKADTSYAFVTNVYNLKDKKVQILEGGKDLAGRIFYRYERNPARFLKRTFEVTRFDTKPVTFDVAPGEDDPVPTKSLKLHDLDDYLTEEMKRYFGDDLEAAANSLDDDDEDDIDEDLDVDDDEDEEDDDDLDDDDDDEEEDDSDDDDLDDDEDDDEEDEDEDLDDEDDDEDDDLDDELDDDDDEEEDEPPAKAKKSASKSKAPTKKAAAKKAAPAKKAGKKK